MWIYINIYTYKWKLVLLIIDLDKKYYVEDIRRVGGNRIGIGNGCCGKLINGLSNSNIWSWQSKFNNDSISSRA